MAYPPFAPNPSGVIPSPPERLGAVLCELGRVERLADLGTNGPLLASAGRDSLFHCLFGRDAIRMAFDLLDDFPPVARSTLIELARLQGVRTNAASDEEPGRILHEHRAPTDAQAGRLVDFGWEFPYYGSVDATPQWINLLGAYCGACGPDILQERIVDRAGRAITLYDSLLSALGWIVGRLNTVEGGGYLWVRPSGPRSIANQVWDDSYDAYYFADGTLFDTTRPYAPIAVQGYTYDALLFCAGLLESWPSPTFDPRWLRTRARRLRERVLSEFWQPDLRTFAIAVARTADGRWLPARVVGSNPGHLLASCLLDGDDSAGVREMLIERLFEPDLLGGAGIRTRSTTAARFRPGSYHNGSIWPMDCGLIADGLRRHTATAAAEDLDRRILAACRVAGGWPEFVRGETDGSIAVNTAIVEEVADGALRRMEQPPQLEQGWTATRVWRILRQHDLLRSE